MAFPFIAAAGLGLNLGSKLFGGKKGGKDRDRPNFFQQNPQELLAILKRGSMGAFAGAGTALKENLANSGLLQSGALPDQFTQLSIAQGQNIAQTESSFLTDVYKQERGAEIDFELADFIEKQKKKRALMEGLFTGLGGLFEAGGSIAAASIGKDKGDS